MMRHQCLKWRFASERAETGAILLSVRGNARSLLSAERTALNMVQRMSAVANETARYVKVVEGTGVIWTLPCIYLRSLKVSSRCLKA